MIDWKQECCSNLDIARRMQWYNPLPHKNNQDLGFKILLIGESWIKAHAQLVKLLNKTPIQFQMRVSFSSYYIASILI